MINQDYADYADDLQSFWLQVGDTVEHVKEPGLLGVVSHIDGNLIQGYGVTTCNIQWSGEYYAPDDAGDIIWTNKLNLVH